MIRYYKFMMSGPFFPRSKKFFKNFLANIQYVIINKQRRKNNSCKRDASFKLI